MTGKNSEKLFTRAALSIPGGVNSPVRAFNAVGGAPLFCSRAEGCHIHDADGNRYIDYIGGWGPMIVGHAHPMVVDTLQAAVKRGNAYGVATEEEVLLAEEIKRRIPSIELMRLVNSGTEAAMSAIRLARAFTGRSKVIKFAGCYHGHADTFLVAAGSGAATFGLPDSPGVTEGCVRDTLIAEFNDISTVQAHFDREGGDIAAVIVEPVSGNMGVIPPANGFLEGLKKICGNHEALLIFDEVMCGFRSNPGGVQNLYGVTPDLTLLGKIIGGGLPVGAFGGRRDVMQMLAPDGPVYQAGTFSGNPIAVKAGLATLDLLDDAAYRRLNGSTAELADGITTCLNDAGVAGTVQHIGSMLTLFFSENPITCYSDAANANHEQYASYFRAMLEQGVLLPPSGYESCFVSLAHDSTAIGKTMDACRSALSVV